jgi:hypothetical protein
MGRMVLFFYDIFSLCFHYELFCCQGEKQVKSGFVWGGAAQRARTASQRPFAGLVVLLHSVPDSYKSTSKEPDIFLQESKFKKHEFEIFLTEGGASLISTRQASKSPETVDLCVTDSSFMNVLNDPSVAAGKKNAHLVLLQSTGVPVIDGASLLDYVCSQQLPPELAQLEAKLPWSTLSNNNGLKSS